MGSSSSSKTIIMRLIIFTLSALLAFAVAEREFNLCAREEKVCPGDIVSLHAHVFYNQGGCQLTLIIIITSTLRSLDVTKTSDLSISNTESLSAAVTTIVDIKWDC